MSRTPADVPPGRVKPLRVNHFQRTAGAFERRKSGRRTVNDGRSSVSRARARGRYFGTPVAYKLCKQNDNNVARSLVRRTVLKRAPVIESNREFRYSATARRGRYRVLIAFEKTVTDRASCARQTPALALSATPGGQWVYKQQQYGDSTGKRRRLYSCLPCAPVNDIAVGRSRGERPFA